MAVALKRKMRQSQKNLFPVEHHNIFVTYRKKELLKTLTSRCTAVLYLNIDVTFCGMTFFFRHWLVLSFIGISPSCSVHEFDGTFQNEHVRFKMTSLCGHVMALDFKDCYNDWNAVQPVSSTNKNKKLLSNIPVE